MAVFARPALCGILYLNNVRKDADMKTLFAALLACVLAAQAWAAGPVIYKYVLSDDGTPRAYDEAAAALSLQGLLNSMKEVSTSSSSHCGLLRQFFS